MTLELVSWQTQSWSCHHSLYHTVPSCRTPTPEQLPHKLLISWLLRPSLPWHTPHETSHNHPPPCIIAAAPPHETTHHHVCCGQRQWWQWTDWSPRMTKLQRHITVFNYYTPGSPGNVLNLTPGPLMSTPLVNTGQPTLYYTGLTFTHFAYIHLNVVFKLNLRDLTGSGRDQVSRSRFHCSGSRSWV